MYPGEGLNTVIDDMGVPGGKFDHGGRNETSWMMYLRPQYVDLGSSVPTIHVLLGKGQRIEHRDR